MVRYLPVAALALISAGGLAAAEPQASEAEGAEARQEKKVCKTEKMTGSLTRVRRTCLTQSEWSRLAEGTRRNIDAITRDGDQGFANRPCAAVQGCAFGLPPTGP